MKNKKTISIGVPCFNEEENVIEAHKELLLVTSRNKNYNYEFIFVDNGSTDKTRELIKKIVKKDKNVVGVFLSRNFGPESSVQAILDTATGDALIMIPADLQEPPNLILEFIEKWEKGYNIVAGIYSKLEDNFFMKFARKSFYILFNFFTGINVPIGDSGYGLIDRKTIDALNSLPEKYRFFRGLRAWVGFKITYVNYERIKRKRGKSSYSLFNYIKHAERSFFGFSYLPLDLIIYFGFILVLLSFIFILVYLFLAIFFANPIKGSITIFVSIVFFGGIQLMAISVIGKYVQVILEETKSRPIYIIDKIINTKRKDLK